MTRQREGREAYFVLELWIKEFSSVLKLSVNSVNSFHECMYSENTFLNTLIGEQ